MAATKGSTAFLEEIADFLAQRPTIAQILDFHPPLTTQARVRELLLRQREGDLTAEQEDELDQFEQGELLFQLIKARLRLRRRLSK